MTYFIFDLNKKQNWIKCLEKLPVDQQDIYYTPEYYSLYENYGDGKAMCFVFENAGEIAIYPFLINSVNDLGYVLDDDYYDIQGAYGYNGVVSSTYSKIFIDNFYKAFNDYCNKQKIIAEFTRFNPYLSNQHFSNTNLNASFNRTTVILNLELDFAEIWTNSYNSNNRNKIRKANKNGLMFEIDNSEIGVKRFYKIYLETMEKINTNTYYYFNENFFNAMIGSEYFNFLFVKDSDNNYLATMILIVYKEYAHYHLSGRSNEAHDNSINNYILDEAIKYAKNEGSKIFHFGGGNSFSESDSLFKFKSNFSKERGKFYIGKKIHNNKVYDEVIKQWEKQNLKNKKISNNILLRYRNI